jgi:hypothetical protein
MKIAFDPMVLDYLDELAFQLYKNEYFGFYETACEYVDKMVDDIISNIHLKPHKKAPQVFTKYGYGMSYFTYQPNKQTTWYIFFNENNNRYLIRFITNNHVSGHLFE